MMLKIYSCSSSLIYGNNRNDENTQAESNSIRTSLASDIASWFYLIKETADCMPDEGWYQLNMPMRSMVYESYNADAEEFGLLKHCKAKSHFYDVWNRNFSNIRLRKHCRFAKCDFCVHWRKISEEPGRKAEALQRSFLVCSFVWFVSFAFFIIILLLILFI